jgi:hypothetical protein
MYSFSYICVQERIFTFINFYAYKFMMSKSLIVSLLFNLLKLFMSYFLFFKCMNLHKAGTVFIDSADFT